MIIRNVTQQDLDEALFKTNHQFDGNIRFKRCALIRTNRNRSQTWGVTLTVQSSKGPGHRMSVSYYNQGRHIAAACWHVHGMFLDNLPVRAEIITMFGRTSPGEPWIDQNIGTSIRPFMASEACECHR